MKAAIVLTVAESKRLIAKGVVALDFVQEKLKSGVIMLAGGTTNGYIYEELTGQTIDKRAFLRGRTTPAKGKSSWGLAPIGDLVLIDGQIRPELDRFSALDSMKAGDIYIKGANALNYMAGIAGVSIGDPKGGTMQALGPVIARKMRLLIPVGLEKELPYDIVEASAMLAEVDESLNRIHSLWPVHGIIYTEIEALGTLFGVEAIPVAAGGIAGAEGGLRMLLVGDGPGVKEAVAFIESIQGEPPIG